LHQPPFTLEIGGTPRASPLARHQANSGNAVTNLRHEMVNLEGFDRFIVMHMDGIRTQFTLAEDLIALVNNGTLVVEQDGKPTTDEARIRKSVVDNLETRLHRLARNALVMA